MAVPGLFAQTMFQMYRGEQSLSGVMAALFRPVRRSTGTTGKSLVWDTKRFDEKIAGTVDDAAGSNLNRVDDFTTKEITPPTYAEAIAINANDLMTRIAGEDPFSASNRSHTARFLDMAIEGMAQMTQLVDRAIELQAAQILQTGELALPGVRPYTEDFFPKSSHFPTAGIAWSNVATAVPLTDLENLAHTIKTDSKKQVVRAFIGRTALAEMLNTDQFKDFGNLRRVNLIEIDPRLENRGASRYGVITVGAFEIELWIYNEDYVPFAGGAKVPFLDTDKVILLPENPGLVVGSLVVPQIVKPDPRVSNLVMPQTKSLLGYDLTPNVWTTSEGTTVYAGIRAKTVLIPQGIDDFGCLTT